MSNPGEHKAFLKITSSTAPKYIESDLKVNFSQNLIDIIKADLSGFVDVVS